MEERPVRGLSHQVSIKALSGSFHFTAALLRRLVGLAGRHFSHDFKIIPGLGDLLLTLALDNERLINGLMILFVDVSGVFSSYCG